MLKEIISLIFMASHEFKIILQGVKLLDVAEEHRIASNVKYSFLLSLNCCACMANIFRIASESKKISIIQVAYTVLG